MAQTSDARPGRAGFENRTRKTAPSPVSGCRTETMLQPAGLLSTAEDLSIVGGFVQIDLVSHVEQLRFSVELVDHHLFDRADQVAGLLPALRRVPEIRHI